MHPRNFIFEINHTNALVNSWYPNKSFNFCKFLSKKFDFCPSAPPQGITQEILIIELLPDFDTYTS